MIDIREENDAHAQNVLYIKNKCGFNVSPPDISRFTPEKGAF
jgi:hypothetical protein